MIKQAEVQNAYLLGRQAAMVKLSNDAELAQRFANDPNATFTDEEMERLTAMNDTPVMDSTVSQKEIDDLVAQSGISPQMSLYQRALSGLQDAGANQMRVLGNIGLTGQGLTTGPMKDDATLLQRLDPRRLGTRQNFSRAGMLAGAGGGAYLGGMDPRAAAIASAGALGGGLVGGNLGQAASAALRQFEATKNLGSNPDMATSIGGALGGLGGGLGAGYLA